MQFEINNDDTGYRGRCTDGAQNEVPDRNYCPGSW